VYIVSNQISNFCDYFIADSMRLRHYFHQVGLLLAAAIVEVGKAQRERLAVVVNSAQMTYHLAKKMVPVVVSRFVDMEMQGTVACIQGTDLLHKDIDSGRRTQD
jgi:hypothetical protein